MGQLGARLGFSACRLLGWLLRYGRYARVRIVDEGGIRRVRKRRLPYAPILLRMADPVLRWLDAGVRFLPQRAWEERERELWRSLHGRSVRVESDGTLVLPCLAGRTLASLLEDAELDAAARRRAIDRAVVALAELHRRGFTHADARAENVMVDLDAGVARWFDFESVHEPWRPLAWRRADDVRALLVTCLSRTGADDARETLRILLDAYADEAVSRLLALRFAKAVRRSLAFELGQAGLTLARSREIARWLDDRERRALTPSVSRGPCSRPGAA